MYFNWSTYQFEEVEARKPPSSREKLFELLSKGEPNAEDVQALIDKDASAVKEKKDGLLPLHTAVLNNASVEVLHVLLKADPSATNEMGTFKDGVMLPLHFVLCERRSLDIVQALLDVYPKGVEARITGEGKLPLSLSLDYGASDDVVLAVLAAYPNAAEDCGTNDDISLLPLLTAIRKKRSLDIVKELLKVYPKGAETRLPEGELPLSLAITTRGISDDVVLAVLEAYPDAVKDTVSNDSSTLPLHLAILKKRSHDVINALIDVYPEGAAVRMKRQREEKLPLSYALTSGVSDDVMLAILSAYPDAAKEKSDIISSHEMVKALLDAYPGAVKEITPTKQLPLYYAIKMKASEEIIMLLANAYPQAAKKRMEDGRLPIEACAVNKASEDLMLALLKLDMPVSIEVGTTVEHCGSWNACVDCNTEVATGAVRRILSETEGGYGKHIHALADACDDVGRSALALASSGPRAAIYEYPLFSGQYRLQTGAPEHRTATSVVLRAQDLGKQSDYGVIFDNWVRDNNGKIDRQDVATNANSIGLDPDLFLVSSEEDDSISKEDFVGICKRQLGDGPREVAIKLMQNKDQWERECNARTEYNLNPKYVVSALSNVPSDTEIAHAVERGDDGLDTIVTKFLGGSKPGIYAIVMIAADRNLHEIFHQEQPEIDAVRVMLRQVFEAVKHLHEKNLMHGDLKMPNIVRFRIDNQLRLIDFDASARIVPMGREEESIAGAKFSSAILPPEMIERIETEEQLEEFNKYWEGEHDKDLVAKFAPKLYHGQDGIMKARYAVKSFHTGKDGKPVDKRLPYELVRASASIDAWALGVLVFTLLTGETLIPSSRDDDCASGAAMHILYSWGTQPEVLSELFKKIDDNAARDLVQQLLQRDPAKRPTITSLLNKHPFFHPERDDEEMKGFVQQMNARLEDIDNTLHSQAKQLEIMNANNLVIKKLSDESRSELFHTRHELLKSIFEATGVKTPTTFIILNYKLPPKASDEKVKKILDLVAAEDGSDVSVDLPDDLQEYRDQVEAGIKWSKRIKSINSKVAAGEVGTAFEIIKEGIKDLISGNEMYLYLIDELTGEPIRADGWPITITGPLEIVPKLFPLMQVGMRAMFFCDGKVGLARMFGFPAKRVPIAWLEGAQESVELLNEECSVEQLWHRACTSRGRYRDSSLRTFVDFLNKNDPGLSKNEHGDFAGLHHIGDPEDGTALWTTLTDPVDIENALKERAKQRREKEKLEHNEHNIQKTVKEQRKLNEHNIQKKVKENTDSSAAAKHDDPDAATDNNCCTKLMMLFGY
eukprot:CAMPEP_0113431400 /NCGR_PEP_ID=MMETSP0013_2-20120614/33564_1 /TAXON_ID=2843 ORGANISM="Skeletonema costatum, Strain 1716" /NCGR_SAMPLE_ID=MMETSP0013_2 /ASSEMBLY_ACC=CAM_ASM_000158 /LENGTH=1290 /DNA_ID=CAMNT_0000320389 /DNA_START=109 /DNA_END=3982 /DNA_ORIENTATION=- /assembly_acc=CAM_ASM_000158